MARQLCKSFREGYSSGTLIEDFDDTGFTQSQSGSGGSLTEQDTEHFKVGTGSIKLYHPVGCNLIQASKTGLSLDFSDMTSLTFWCYIDGNADSFDLIVYLETDTSNYFTFRYEGDKVLNNTGWFCFKVPKEQFSETGTGNWASIANIRFRAEDSSIYTDGTQAFTVWFDSVYQDVKAKTKLMIRFDDGTPPHYDNGFTYMNPLGLVGNVALISDNFDNDVIHMTPAEITEMYNAGWGICNHSSDGENVVDVGDDQFVTNVMACADEIVNRGWKGSENILIYPGCKMNETTMNTLRDEGIIVALKCFGSTFDEVIPCDYHPNDSTLGGANLMNIYGKMHDTAQSDTDLTNIAYVDKLITSGSSGVLTFHGITGAVGLGITEAHFQNVMDHVAFRRNQGLIDVVTFKEFHQIMQA